MLYKFTAVLYTIYPYFFGIFIVFIFVTFCQSPGMFVPKLSKLSTDFKWTGLYPE